MKKSLLIVDDNPEILNIIQDYLSDIFDNIMTATSVDEALDLLSKNQFTLITLDINLQGRNGSEIIKFLIESTENKNKKTPIVLISGLMTVAFMERNKPRFAGVLLKPFDLDVLKNIAIEAHAGTLPTLNPIDTTDFADIPYLKCKMPFTVHELEEKVSSIIIEVRKNKNLKKLFTALNLKREADSYMTSHQGLLINISAAISMKMEWNTDKTLAKLVYSAYLHDMALANNYKLAQINNLEKLLKLKVTLSDTEYKLVYQHPNIAATTLADIKEIPADVVTIVRQHHEMPHKNGFPSKISHQHIIPLSAIFIVAHDLADYIIDDPNWNLDKYLHEATDKFSGPHFIKALAALKTIS